MQLSKKIILGLLFISLSLTAHKYYLSLTQIEYNNNQETLEVIINVFMDDIEHALNNEYTIDLKLTSKDELKNNDQYFIRYLNENLTFKVNNKNVPFSYIGKEYDGDLVYFYLEINNITNPTSINISNSILLKYFEEQVNIVKVKIDKISQSKILNKKKNKALLNF